MGITETFVDAIEGIGPSYKQKLSDFGINTIHDLLLYTPSAISNYTGISIIQLEDWRAAAVLLGIDVMTAQWAEALVKAGVKTLDGLFLMELDSLQQIFTDAVEAGTIPAAPDDATIFQLCIKATQLHYGGLAQGRINNPAGEPLAGALVQLGQQTTNSNAQGVWRISGIHLTGVCPIFITLDGYTTYYQANFPIDMDNAGMTMEQIVLEEGASSPILWDEFTGDDLPNLSYYHQKMLIDGPDDLRKGDILRMHKTYKNGDLKFVSVFMAKENNQLLIRCFRLPTGLFVETPPINSYWRYTASGLSLLDVPAAGISVLKKLRKVTPKIDITGMTRDEILTSFQNITIDLKPNSSI